MATIRFVLGTRTDRLGRMEIRALLFHGHNGRLQTRTGIWVNPKRWDNTQGRIIIPRIATSEQKELVDLADKLHRIKDSALRLWDERHTSSQWLANLVSGIVHPVEAQSEDTDLMKMWNEFCRYHNVSEIRQKNFKSVGKIVERWLGGVRFPVSKLTEGKVQELWEFLQTEGTRGENANVEIMRRFRTFARWLYTNGHIAKNPFDKFHIPQPTYMQPFYLTKEERDHLASFPLKSHALSVQRDIFILQCHIGCRIGDYHRLTPDNIRGDVLEYVANKTLKDRGDVIRVPLTATAKRIIDKYKGGATLVPHISEQKYNDAIKAMFREAGLDRPVSVIDTKTTKEIRVPLCDVASSHLARRTFVGILVKEVKDTAMVGSLSGHKPNSRAIGRYYGIDDEMRRDIVAHLE